MDVDIVLHDYELTRPRNVGVAHILAQTSVIDGGVAVGVHSEISGRSKIAAGAPIEETSKICTSIPEPRRMTPELIEVIEKCP
jgi:hypothetical protein